MQTKPFGIFINIYNLSRTTRKSVKINRTSALLLCKLCFFPHKTGQTIVKHFILLNPSCDIPAHCILGNLKNFCPEESKPTFPKIENFYKSRTRLPFCQKPIRAHLPVGRSYIIAESSWPDQVHAFVVSAPCPRMTGNCWSIQLTVPFVSSQCQ